MKRYFAALVLSLWTGILHADSASRHGHTDGKMPALLVDSSPVNDGRGPAIVSYADVLVPIQKTVVSVKSTLIVREQRQIIPGLPFAEESDTKEEGLGSGVIVSENGYILTNNHVVADADTLEVELPDGRTFKARVVGTDPKTDVAVIKIEEHNLPAVVVADSDKLRVGDIVFAVGNPLGVGQTVTMGIISATGREVHLLDDVSGYENFIQTDAAINQGNSGGALVDAKGRLIGINSAILSTSRGNIGIGFAIPINLASNVMRSLIQTGTVSRGFLGIEADDLTSLLAEKFGVPANTRGVVVTTVSADSPADKAGIRPGDVITEINHRAVVSRQELRLFVAELTPNSEATVKVFRDGKPVLFNTQVGKLSELTRDELLPGIHVSPLTEEVLAALGLEGRLDQGILVTKVDPDSPYANRFAVNMVIAEINRYPVDDVDSARQTLVTGRKNVFLVVLRGHVRYVTVVVK